MNDRDIDSADGPSVTTSTGPAAPASPASSDIVVPPHPGTITQVEVFLLLEHTNPDDLDILLVAPDGSNLVLLSDAGGSTDFKWNLHFNDAFGPAPNTTDLRGGSLTPSYHPTDYDDPGDSDSWPAAPPLSGFTNLSDFIGRAPSGKWSLYVSDDSNGEGGILSSWSLSIRTNANPPFFAADYPSTVSVSGLPKGVTDVNLVLNDFTHFNFDDVDMMLVGPGGQSAMVMGDAGGDFARGPLDLVMDDQAAAVLPDVSALTSGTYRPANFDPPDSMPAPAPNPSGVGSTLSVFNGTDPNGTWRLFVVDDSLGADGFIDGGWALQVSTVDPPTTPAITSPATGTRDRDGAVLVTGLAQANSTVTLFDGSASNGTTTASALGQWSMSLSGLAEGSHTFTASSVDQYGNSSPMSGGVVIAVDTIRPRVASTVPRSHAKRASRRANIKARMNEALRPSTVTRQTVFIKVVGTKTHLRARVLWRAGTRSIVINPRHRLLPDTTYKVVVTTHVRDLAGNRLDQKRTKAGLQKKTWRFTTR